MTESTKREFLNLVEQLKDVSPEAKAIIKRNVTDQTSLEEMCFFLARKYENNPKGLTPHTIRLLNAFSDYIEPQPLNENHPLKKN